MKTGSPVRRQRFEQDALPHLPALWQAALWLTLSQSHAENLVVETMGQAYCQWHIFDDGADNKARLFRILSREHFGPSNGLQILSQPLSEQHPAAASHDRGRRPSSEETAIGGRDGLLLSGISDVSLQRAIARLRPQSRLIMILLFRERFSYADIAYILDLQETSVRTILSRLRCLIPHHLARYAEATTEVDDDGELTHHSVRLEGTTEATPEPSSPGWEFLKDRRAGQE